MTVWFTSDSHFGHERIIKLCRRPFASVEEMDEHLIERWNTFVQGGDTVYHLGDFAFAEHTQYLDRLRGHKHLILGNHDPSNRVRQANGWSSVNQLMHVTVAGQPLVLCHYAMRVWNRSSYGSIHLYGHSHGNLEGDAQSCDVGVDAWPLYNFAPLTLSDIKQRLATFPEREEPDHHQPRGT